MKVCRVWNTEGLYSWIILRKETDIVKIGKKRIRPAWFLLLLGAGSMGYGIYRQEYEAVFRKAVNICLECIGVG